MKVSALFNYTRKEVPKNAEVVSHQFLLRAGLIKQIGAGIYCYTPLMVRVLRKIESIVREEMDDAGAQELLMTVLQPRELWEESGRYANYLANGTMFTLKDRKDFDLCLGPTHEEVITELVRKDVSSYKNLPLNLYQIQNKFRDELRPRFGLLRCREFIMKDAYSFDRDETNSKVVYDRMYKAYCNILTRLGLEFRVVEADTGDIGGAHSHEFMILAESGEDTIIYCDNCDYGANQEKADSLIIPLPYSDKFDLLHKEPTPDIRTVEELCEFFSMKPQRMVKTILFKADDRNIAVLMRGDRQINEIKLKNILGALNIRPLEETEILELTGTEKGFAGPVNLSSSFEIIADQSVNGMTNFLCGCNEKDFHLLCVNYGRDFPVPSFYNLSLAQPGEHCPRCSKGTLSSKMGIEAGHIFMLGTKYSKAMNACYTDEKGVQHPIYMGCYGFGVSRVVAGIIEQSHDDFGIIWPLSVAPYQIALIPVKYQAVKEQADSLYSELKKDGYQVILDDSENSAGFKFKDADLIGYPVRVVLGKDFQNDGRVEVKLRNEKDKSLMTIEELNGFLKKVFS